MGVPRRQFSNDERSLDSRAARSDGRSMGVSFDRRLDRDTEAGDFSESEGQGSTGFASGWMLLSPEGRRTRLTIRECHGLCPRVSTPHRSSPIRSPFLA
jgi:hypothetical protein